MKPQRRNTNQQKNTLYEITFKGLYRARSGKEDKPFTCQMQMRDSHIAQNPLSMFKKHGKNIMLSKFPDFAGLVKYWVESAVNLDDPDQPIENLRIMSRQQLTEYVNENELEIIFSLYPTDESLRTAIEECEKEPEAFYIHQDILYSKRGSALEAGEELAQLNANRTSGGKPVQSVQSQVQTQAQTQIQEPLSTVSFEDLEATPTNVEERADERTDKQIEKPKGKPGRPPKVQTQTSNTEKVLSARVKTTILDSI